MASVTSPTEQYDSVKKYDVVPALQTGCHIDAASYEKLYKESIENPDEFFGTKAKEFIKWIHPFKNVSQGGFENGDVAWFTGGKLNVSDNCIDRHIEAGKGDQVALIWEANDTKDTKTFTYNDVLRHTCAIANVLKDSGVRRGDPVTIYLPMIPECAFTMLACTRIGAPHSVVFAGFSSEALRSRIIDAQSKWVITSNCSKRGSKTLPLKKLVDAAIDGIAPSEGCVEKCFVFVRDENEAFDMNKRKSSAPGYFKPGFTSKDVLMTDLVANARPYCPPEEMDSEDTLFFLYTSGSTGKPKGVAHTTAGYLLWASMTQKYVFDYREGDVYACVADCGWITGHTYIVYGPLANGATTVMFESTPLFPDPGRYWELVEKHKVTQFYTAPTAIRALMRHDTKYVTKYDRSSLRILGTVGEPINPEAWEWYFNVVGEKKCAIVDTWWQTETGGNMMTPLPGVTKPKPGACCSPFLGVDPVILDQNTGAVIEGNGVEGVLAIRKPWPGMARTVFGNHQRYLNVYMRPYKGYYFPGDGCVRDKDGYYWITGRVDDVINTSGHRLGTAEIEAALATHADVGEAAVVGFPHATKGQGLFCYVVLNVGAMVTDALEKELKMTVRKEIGPFATPDKIIVVPGLPKTRSGKVMRRILRKIAEGTRDLAKIGDVSTLADSSIPQKVLDCVVAKE